MSRSQLGCLIFGMVHFGLAAFFGRAFYDRFWRWRHELSEINTSFLTPDGANITASGMFWILPAGLFALLGLRCIVRCILLSLRDPKTA